MANTYLVQKGDTASRIAQKYGTTVSALQQANPQYQQFVSNQDYIQAGWNLNLPVKPLQPLQPGSAGLQQSGVKPVAVDIAEAPEVPTYEPSTPPDDLSLKEQLDQQRKTLETTYQLELDKINKELEESKRKKEELTTKQEGVLKEAEPLTAPFREVTENAERKRLKIEENYFANQALTNELDRLLTESMEMTRKLQTQKVPGLAGLQQSERMVKAQQNVQGRIAVVEAVMSARNNQIGVGLGFIDRTLNNIQADRQDKLNYLNTLYNFYETSRSEEGEKIFNLTNDQKDIIKAQIGLIEGDLARAEKTADTVRNMILENPQMAAESGISLNDTEEEITKKISDWQYNTEVRELKNTAEQEGMKYLTPEQAATKADSQIFTQIDSKGVERQFLLPPVTAEWELKTIGGDLYRVDPKTGGTELLIRGDTSTETEKIPDWFIADIMNEYAIEKQMTPSPWVIQQRWDEEVMAREKYKWEKGGEEEEETTASGWNLASDDDKILVERWVYSQPEFTPEDIEKLRTDSKYFYWALEKAEEEL